MYLISSNGISIGGIAIGTNRGGGAWGDLIPPNVKSFQFKI